MPPTQRRVVFTDTGQKSAAVLAGARPQAGFTIIELMITVAIVGILATVAIPQMNYAIQNSRVRTAVSDTHTSLLLARSEAIKRNSNVSLERTGADWLGGWSVLAGTTPIVTQDPFSGVTAGCFTTPNASTTCGDTLTFQRTGRASSYIEFRYYSTTEANIAMRCVRVDLSGRPGVTVDTNNDPSDGCN